MLIADVMPMADIFDRTESADLAQRAIDIAYWWSQMVHRRRLTMRS